MYLISCLSQEERTCSLESAVQLNFKKSGKVLPSERDGMLIISLGV